MITSYSQFIQAVTQYGLMTLGSSGPEGFPALTKEVTETCWHTGDPITDPWQWKDVACTSKDAIFTNLPNGQKLFVSPELYPLYYCACHPDASLADRYADGLVARTTMQVYALFEERPFLSIHQVRTALRPRTKEDVAAMRKALIELTHHCYLALCGCQQKQNKAGMPYGWPVNTYAPVAIFLQDVLDGCTLPNDQARERLLDCCCARFPVQSKEKLSRFLFGANR